VSYIVLNEAQARVIAQGKGDVEVRDGNGKHLGYITQGFTDEDIRIARERAESEGPWLLTAEVLDRLR
jgi:hypothetical protein